MTVQGGGIGEQGFVQHDAEELHREAGQSRSSHPAFQRAESLRPAKAAERRDSPKASESERVREPTSKDENRRQAFCMRPCVPTMTAEPPSDARGPWTSPSTELCWMSDGRRERHVASLSG